METCSLKREHFNWIWNPFCKYIPHVFLLCFFVKVSLCGIGDAECKKQRTDKTEVRVREVWGEGEKTRKKNLETLLQKQQTGSESCWLTVNIKRDRSWRAPVPPGRANTLITHFIETHGVLRWWRRVQVLRGLNVVVNCWQREEGGER